MPGDANGPFSIMFVYFDNSMTLAQRELTYLTFRTEVDPQTREALAPACPARLL